MTGFADGLQYAWDSLNFSVFNKYRNVMMFRICKSMAKWDIQTCVQLNLPKIWLSKLLNNNIPYSLDVNRVADK